MGRYDPNPVKTDEYAEYKLIDRDDKESYPTKFDIVKILLSDDTVIPGWYQGYNNWNGFRWKYGMKVKGWKRSKELYI